jgi:hypothetical protein
MFIVQIPVCKFANQTYSTIKTIRMTKIKRMLNFVEWLISVKNNQKRWVFTDMAN